MSYTKIVQVGAGGNVGTPILNALIASNKFEITVVTRASSSYTPPSNNVRVVKADYSDHNALVEAFKGQDALLITIGDMPNLAKNSKVLIDAAIDAGVKRVLPSEYGNDISSEPGKSQTIFTPKLKVNEYLEEKGAEGKIEYSIVATGPFFDWGLTHKFLGFDLQNKKATLYNGGNQRFNTTTTEHVGQAVVAILSSPDGTKNKHVRVHDFRVSQKDILAILEEETNSKFTVENVPVDTLAQEAAAKLKAGEVTEANVYAIVKSTIFGSTSSAAWDAEDDTETLGLPKKDLREEIKKVL